MERLDYISYSRPGDRRVRRWTVRSIESVSGRRKLLKLYKIWRSGLATPSTKVFGSILEIMRIRLAVKGLWPQAETLPDRLVIVANHPFGIGDGVALLALAERLDRPFRILIHNDLMQIPEMAAYGLPVSFEETRAAIDLNLKTKRRAAELLASGTAIIIFPAGGVATAPKMFGAADDLPWKQFTARLVQSCGASVLPVFFEGQNGPLFHLVSKFSLTIRIGLLIGAFRRLEGREIRATVGEIIPASDLRTMGDRRQLTQELRGAVYRLAPSQAARAA